MEEKLFNALVSVITEMEVFWDKEGVEQKYEQANLPECNEFDKAYFEAKDLIKEYKSRHESN